MLGIYNGPLDQFKDVLERMVEKIIIFEEERSDQVRLDVEIQQIGD